MSMKDPGNVVRFVLGGQSYQLTRSEVEGRLAGVQPQPVGTHAVRINGNWYPVRQAFEVASGIPGTLFNSHTARRHFANLGLEIQGEIKHHDESASPVIWQPLASGDAIAQEEGPWQTEAHVQASVISALRSLGWLIISQANTATKEHGIDVVASLGSQIAGIEVKGFPTRTYADSRRHAETKPTQPSTQAGHWYSQAVLAAMRLRTRHPDYLSVVALPDFNRYRTLFAETRSSLEAAAIHVWWVHPSGTMEGL
jgi:hypothetical protein